MSIIYTALLEFAQFGKWEGKFQRFVWTLFNGFLICLLKLYTTMLFGYKKILKSSVNFTFFFFFFLSTMRCLELAGYIQKTHLSHITLTLVIIQTGIDHKDSKSLPQNTTEFSVFKLKTSKSNSNGSFQKWDAKFHFAILNSVLVPLNNVFALMVSAKMGCHFNNSMFFY